MKRILIKNIILLIFLTSYIFSNAQERYEVTLTNDTIYNHGVPQFLCQGKESKKASVFSLRSFDKTLQGLLIFRFEDDGVNFSASFPYLGVRYARLYTKIEILTLMDSYLRSKVMVNGKANLKGLQAYCDDHGISLVKVPSRKVQRPVMNDTLLIARAKEDALNQVKFTFHNNASKPVRIFIGNKPKGGSGRIQVIAPRGDLNEHARKTEKIFLLNDAGDEIQSIAVTDSLMRIVIKASADGFE